MKTCELCGGRGYWLEELVDEVGISRLTMVVCPCKMDELKRKYKIECGLAPHLQNQTFEKFDMSFYTGDKKGRAQAALKAAKKFAVDVAAGEKPKGLLFLGSVGSGKTYLAAAVASKVMDDLITVEKIPVVRFVIVPDLLDEIRASFRDGSSLREEDIVRRVKDVSLLVLDDLGADNSSDFAVRVIFGIINYRVNHELPTIITTNLNHKQIEEVYGSRICSRLAELCRFFPLEADKDIRIAKTIRERG